MEEWVGKIWHRLITRAANSHYPEAAVSLSEVSKVVGILFRALGGDGGLRVEAAGNTGNESRRTFLQRMAGSNQKVTYGWRDEQALLLPPEIDVFPETQLNRDLYLWLAAMAAVEEGTRGNWFVHNQMLTQKVLQAFPGMQHRYQRLLQAQLSLRPAIDSLRQDEAAQEAAICEALQQPGSAAQLPRAGQAPHPVYLWLHPAPPLPMPANAAHTPEQDDESSDEGEIKTEDEQTRRQAERVDMPEGNQGIILDRFENIFSWAEYTKVDRATDEEEDLDAAEKAADDLDVISVAQDQKSSAKRLRFDLDLPSEESDDLCIGEGILLPEWDYRKSVLRPDHCRIQPMLARDSEAIALPKHLRATARRLRSQFESLMPVRYWHRGEQDGSEIDLDAYMIHATERRRGQASAEQGLYRDFRGGMRDLSCLVLADLSLSTDAWVNSHARVIDVIRDSLMLFSEALSATGDQFAMYGFSSRRRDHVRIHTLKEFSESHNDVSRGRIQAIKPGFYTRMGAAIRHASRILKKQPNSQKLLLILTDGKPNDLDQYEGRYGVEDTRVALIEARRDGLQPFCVTIDEKAGDYLPHIFGSNSYVVIRKPSELPREFPLLYARLTS
ncbi:MAG TPA: VWA domain-containing protein [Gammaproteobacteria bacterium]|nr:VWA domain-containing protein [Gammaproteobacteria bacterium]